MIALHPGGASTAPNRMVRLVLRMPKYSGLFGMLVVSSVCPVLVVPIYPTVAAGNLDPLGRQKFVLLELNRHCHAVLPPRECYCPPFVYSRLLDLGWP